MLAAKEDCDEILDVQAYLSFSGPVCNKYVYKNPMSWPIIFFYSQFLLHFFQVRFWAWYVKINFLLFYEYLSFYEYIYTEYCIM